MHRRLTSAVIGLACTVSLSGCFLERPRLGGVDASAPRDGGAIDGGAIDGGAIDAGPDARVVPPVDASAPDAAPGCTPADEGCDGNLRRYCESEAILSEDCGPTRHCDDAAGAPLCVMNACVPDSTRCNAEGTAGLTCDSRGAGESSAPCSRGCAAGACRLATAWGAAIFATMSSGTVRVDLCGAGTDQAHTDACPYASQSPAGEDVMIRLEVDRRRPIRFEARQVSMGETSDPTVFLRSACEDMGSEI